MMIIEHVFNKLSAALSTAWGWVVCLGLIAANFLAGYETMVGFTVFAVVMDAAWGIASSVKQGRFTKSELMRESLSKLAVYGSVILLFILIDKLMDVSNGLSASVVCICIIQVELWSSAASMLICFPHMPFLKLLKQALVGEIASKLNVKPEDVEAALNNMDRNETNKVHCRSLHGKQPEDHHDEQSES